MSRTRFAFIAVTILASCSTPDRDAAQQFRQFEAWESWDGAEHLVDLDDDSLPEIVHQIVSGQQRHQLTRAFRRTLGDGAFDLPTASHTNFGSLSTMGPVTSRTRPLPQACGKPR